MRYLDLTMLLIFFTANLINAQNNEELQDMADADQQSRLSGHANWLQLKKQDSLRRLHVFELIENDKLQTAKDHYNAGIIFQHGNDTVASKIAVESFRKAIEIDSTLNRWWYAAAVDRDLMRRGRPQIYGTQFIKNESTNGKFKRYKIDSTVVTDKQRQYYHVEALQDQREKERLMNLRNINTFYAENRSLEKTLDLIRSEFKKGNKSEYNVNENFINNFGYNLIENDKLQEALEVLKLNTQLYPEAFNTYDSYGEILLKLDKTNEALKAYRKSLDLNPDNKNAKEVLKHFE